MSAPEETPVQTQAQERRGGGMAFVAIVPLAAFTALVVLFYFGLYRGDPSTLPSTLIGKPVPEFTLPAVDGLLEAGVEIPGFADTDLRSGEPVIVNVWASWCGPCRAEHPYLMHLATEVGITIYGINNKDAAANARRFLGHHGNPFKAVGADGVGRVSIDWGVYGVPETFLIDGNGIIIYKHVGEITPSVLETELLPAIEQLRSVAN